MATTKIAPKSKKVKSTIAKKAFTHFYMTVLSRHPSTSGLRKKILVKGGRLVYRHGSTTSGNYEYEINSVKSIENSADKLKMKECFDKAEVKQALWLPLPTSASDKAVFEAFLKKLKFPEDKDSWLIIKQRWGSRGNGNYLVRTRQELDGFLKTHSSNLRNYIIEEYKHYSVEYRIHVSELGYFYTCRKVLKSDTPKDQRFQRHDDNSSWLVETNSGFNKPNNWKDIVADCVRALKAIDADVLAFDVKCTSIKDKKSKDCKWIIIESCSAPSFGTGTLKNYIEHLPKVIKHKYNLEARS